MKKLQQYFYSDSSCFSQEKVAKTDVFSVKDRTVTVYTSANSTDLRLTKTNTNLQFKDLKQPLETQVCVFVNPAKTFQTYLGLVAQ
jgi:glucosylceramidase